MIDNHIKSFLSYKFDTDSAANGATEASPQTAPVIGKLVTVYGTSASVAILAYMMAAIFRDWLSRFANTGASNRLRLGC